MDQWQWNASTPSTTNTTWNQSFLSQDLDPGNQTRSTAPANKWCETAMLFAINSVGAGILCVLGLLGNAISFAILSQDRTTSPVAAFLLESLSISDSVFLVVWLLQFSTKDLFNFVGSLDRTLSVAYTYTRAYTYPLAFIAQTATIWLTVLIAASRYVAVCVPYRASSYCTLSVTKRATLGVVAFAVVYNLPRFFENEIAVTTTKRRNTTRHQLQRTPLGQHHLYQVLYFDALYYVVSFVLPLLLLSVFNSQLIVAYRAVQRRRSAMMRRRCNGGGAVDSHEQNITLVMIVVILVFMVCNAPARVVQIVWQYNPQPCPTAPFLVIQLSNVLEVFSSSSNFLVYCGFRKQFRRALRMRVTACATAVASRSRDLSDQTTVNATDGPLAGTAAADCDETEVQQSVV